MALSFPGSLVDSFIEDDLMKEDGLGEFLVRLASPVLKCCFFVLTPD